MNFQLRRAHFANDTIMNKAMKVPPEAKTKRAKNVEVNEITKEIKFQDRLSILVLSGLFFGIEVTH